MGTVDSPPPTQVMSPSLHELEVRIKQLQDQVGTLKTDDTMEQFAQNAVNQMEEISRLATAADDSVTRM